MKLFAAKGGRPSLAKAGYAFSEIFAVEDRGHIVAQARCGGRFAFDETDACGTKRCANAQGCLYCNALRDRNGSLQLLTWFGEPGSDKKIQNLPAKVVVDYEHTTFTGGAPNGGDRTPENFLVTRFQLAY